MTQLSQTRTIIFDMDGVIVDSELHWEDLEPEYLASVIPNWDHGAYSNLTGLSLTDVYTFLRANYQLTLGESDFRNAYERMADEIYGKRISLLPGAKELVAGLHKKGVTLGLASSSPRRWIEIVLSRFELNSYFSAVLSGAEIAGKGKPSPDIYLTAAKALNAAPNDCIAIEDSRNGVLAAKAAGMYCYGLRNGFNDGQDLSSADEEIVGFAPLLKQL